MPSADMRSNRCVPLRGTSAGYASASSASIRLLKSGGAPPLRRVVAGDGVNLENLTKVVNNYFSYLNFRGVQVRLKKLRVKTYAL